MMKNQGKEKWILISAFLISLLLHSVAVFCVKLPTSGPDELATISSAAYIAGYDWSSLVSRHNAYYGFGSAWFLFPIFLIFKDPIIIYILLRLCLAIILSIPAIIAYKIMKDLLKIKNKTLCFCGAIACSFFNNTTADAFVNESMLILICWLIVYILLKISSVDTRKQKNIYTFILALTMCYSLTIHTRALLYYAALVVVYVAFLIIYKERILNELIFGITSFLIIPTNKLMDYVKGILYNVDSDVVLNNSADYYMTEVTSDLGITIEVYGITLCLIGVLIVIVTNFVGIMAHTAGLIVPATTVFIKNVWEDIRTKSKKNYTVNLLASFVIVGLFGTLISFGFIHMYHGIKLHTGIMPGDGRFFFYLRYFNNFIPPFLLVIISFLDKLRRHNKYILGSSGIIYVVVIVLFSILFIRKIDMVNIAAFDVGGVISSLSLRTSEQIFTIANYYLAIVMVIVLATLIYILARKNKNTFAMMLILSLLFYQQMFKTIEFKVPNANLMYNCVDATHELIIKNEDICKELDVIYTYSEEAYRMQYVYQLLFFDKEIIPFKESGNEYQKGVFDTSTAVPIVKGEEYILISNNILEIEDSYMAILDENEYVYTNSIEYVKLFEEYVENIVFQ